MGEGVLTGVSGEKPRNLSEQGREQGDEEISAKETAWLEDEKRLDLKSGDPEFQSKLDRHPDLFLGNLEYNSSTTLKNTQ